MMRWKTCDQSKGRHVPRQAGFNVYSIRKRADTGDWLVDGELGRATYPGEWQPEKVREYYGKGLSADGKSFAW